ncbi:MAG: D-alanyl-D-alanine carboxypeptidase family protein [Fimbriimonadaceae bacterium]|nr:D-alanyl-D-alanine carboxypeptidase family protein [Fimbriimonadaceae bacterium]
MSKRAVAKWDKSRGRPEPVRLLNLILEEENGEPLVSLAEVSPSVMIWRSQVIPYLRKRVAEMLEEAAQSLPDGYKFGVIDAWRPFARQVRIYEWMTRCALEVWPDLPYAQLKRKVNRWVAPIDQPAPPGHCTGAAVDVFLIGPDGEQADVWSPFTRFTSAPTYSLGLTEEAAHHRNMMVQAMLGVGFSNCRDEWWHYSYGDAGWAVRLGHDSCVYGKADLAPDLYETQERVWQKKQKSRPNPFLEG